MTGVKQAKDSVSRYPKSCFEDRPAIERGQLGNLEFCYVLILSLRRLYEVAVVARRLYEVAVVAQWLGGVANGCTAALWSCNQWRSGGFIKLP